MANGSERSSASSDTSPDEDYDAHDNCFWSWIGALMLADTEALMVASWKGMPKSQIGPALSANAMEPMSVLDPATKAGVRNIVRIRCACGAHCDVNRAHSFNVEHLSRAFKNKDWIFEHGRWICQPCQAKKKPAPEKPKEIPMQITPTTAPAAQPVNLGPVQVAKVLRMLDEHFNSDKGAFHEGWSDERISRELNVPRIHVIQIREETHGKLKMDPEIVALRSDIEAAEQMATELSTIIGDLKTRLVRLEKRHSA